MSRFWHVRLLMPVEAVIEAIDDVQARRRGLELLGQSEFHPHAEGLVHASIGIPTCLSVSEIEEPTPVEAWE